MFYSNSIPGDLRARSNGPTIDRMDTNDSRPATVMTPDLARERAAAMLADASRGPAMGPFAPPEPPQRTIGWRHLPEERWPRERIVPAPWNDKVRKMSPDKFARLRRGIQKHGLAGTLNVRAEDGLCLGGQHRFMAACELIDTARADFERANEADNVDAAVLEAELERLGVAGGLFRVSPILGIPDAQAAALSVLLNNREAQGDFDPMGLGEILSEYDAAGFDLTDTGFELSDVEHLSIDDDEAPPNVPAAPAVDPQPPAVSSNSRKKRTRAEVIAFPYDADDLTLAARALETIAKRPGMAKASQSAARAAAKRLLKGADHWRELRRAGTIGDRPRKSGELTTGAEDLSFG